MGSNYPSFQDFRTTRDGVMVADLGFKKQLWALDPELDVVWDWGSERWEIWRFPGQKNKKFKRINRQAHHVMTVQTKDKEFKELGASILIELQKADTHRYGFKELYRYFEQMDENIQRAKQKNFLDEIDSITNESYDYFRGVTKKTVPFSYNIKPSEQRLLLNVTPKTARPNLHIFKPSRQNLIRDLVGVGNA